MGLDQLWGSQSERRMGLSYLISNLTGSVSYTWEYSISECISVHGHTNFLCTGLSHSLIEHLSVGII